MYRVAKAMVHSDAECADAIQETILKAYQSIKNLRNEEYIKTWLIRILINECNNILKQRKRVIPMERMREEMVHPRVQERLEMEEAINSLDEKQRVIVTLFYIEDVPLKEITNLLGIAEGTAKSRLYRAREQLMHLLGDHVQRGSSSHE